MNRHQRRAIAAQQRHQPEKTPPRVALCIPSGAMWYADMSLSLLGTVLYAAGQIGVIPVNQKGSYIGQNRNLIAYKAVYEGAADWLYWQDTDNVVPVETLLTLLDHEKDIVGCDYRKRLDPYDRIGIFLGDDPGVAASGLHEMKLLPHGVLLVRAEVYKKMPWPWYREEYYGSNERHLIHVNPGGLKNGEDTIFTQEAREAGFQVWCDMDLTKRVSHIGERAVGYVTGGGAF